MEVLRHLPLNMKLPPHVFVCQCMTGHLDISHSLLLSFFTLSSRGRRSDRPITLTYWCLGCTNDQGWHENTSNHPSVWLFLFIYSLEKRAEENCDRCAQRIENFMTTKICDLRGFTRWLSYVLNHGRRNFTCTIFSVASFQLHVYDCDKKFWLVTCCWNHFEILVVQKRSSSIRRNHLFPSSTHRIAPMFRSITMNYLLQSIKKLNGRKLETALVKCRQLSFWKTTVNQKKWVTGETRGMFFVPCERLQFFHRKDLLLATKFFLDNVLMDCQTTHAAPPSSASAALPVNRRVIVERRAKRAHEAIPESGNNFLPQLLPPTPSMQPYSRYPCPMPSAESGTLQLNILPARIHDWRGFRSHGRREVGHSTCQGCGLHFWWSVTGPVIPN